MKNDKKWYQKPSNLVMTIACIILIPVLIINLYIIYQANTNKDEVPNIFGYKPFIVLSGSMESKIHKGDLIFVKEVDPSDLVLEDVIAFRDAEDTVTTHRIIDIVDKDGITYFITKGDNNTSQDQNLVEFEDVEGIYVGRISNIGNIMKSLSEPTTIIIIALGITVIFVIGYTISNKKLKEEERQEFLEYKRMKELEEQRKQEELEEAKKVAKKKTVSKETKPVVSKSTKKKVDTKTSNETNTKKETKKTETKVTKKKSNSKETTKKNSK